MTLQTFQIGSDKFGAKRKFIALAPEKRGPRPAARVAKVRGDLFRTASPKSTDIAARGIDLDAVSHVVNFDLPNVPESHVHRIGRTARAGADGVAVSLVADDERGLLKDIQKVTRQTIPSFDRRNDRALGALAAVEKTLSPEPPRAQPVAKRGAPPAGGSRGRRNGGGGGGGRSHQPNGSQGGHMSKPRTNGPRPIAATQPAARWSPVD